MSETEIHQHPMPPMYGTSNGRMGELFTRTLLARVVRIAMSLDLITGFLMTISLLMSTIPRHNLFTEAST